MSKWGTEFKQQLKQKNVSNTFNLEVYLKITVFWLFTLIWRLLIQNFKVYLKLQNQINNEAFMPFEINLLKYLLNLFFTYIYANKQRYSYLTMTILGLYSFCIVFINKCKGIAFHFVLPECINAMFKWNVAIREERKPFTLSLAISFKENNHIKWVATAAL